MTTKFLKNDQGINFPIVHRQLKDKKFTEMYGFRPKFNGESNSRTVEAEF